MDSLGVALQESPEEGKVEKDNNDNTQTNSSGNRVFIFSLKVTAQFLAEEFGQQIEIERP